MTEKKPQPSPTPKTRSRKARHVREDEAVLWGIATQDVQRVRKKTDHSALSHQVDPEFSVAPAAPLPPTKIAVPVGLGASLPSAPPPSKNTKNKPGNSEEKSGKQIDAALRKRFVRGDVPIDGRIDLHGLTVAQAHTQFLKFMMRQIAAEARCVLVVTGKGRGGEGLIRKTLPLWCEDEKLHPFILQSAPAAPKDGGAGAVYFLLRRKRK